MSIQPVSNIQTSSIQNNWNIGVKEVLETKYNKPIKDIPNDIINDRIDLSIPQEYLNIVKWMENVTGQKCTYKTPEQIRAYLASLNGYSQKSYDTHGFLKNLGLENLKSSGRTLNQFLLVLNTVENYKPNNTFIQKPFFWLLKKDPQTFESISDFVNLIAELPCQIKKEWEKPFQTGFKPNPNNPIIPANQWYQNVQMDDKGAIKVKKLSTKDITTLWGEDFHMGDPDNNTGFNYGTFSIAKSLGFTDAQARRISLSNIAIDENKSIYGRTDSFPFGDMDRHFNLNLSDINKEEDTRLIWARRHLEQAVILAKKGAYLEAEQELGYGLHSLQDMFAHGQLKSTEHGTMGNFPDMIAHNPIGFAEATLATTAYLKAYLNLIM